MNMARKLALVDYGVCRPERCPGGVCAAALACPSQLLHQETPYTPPMPEPAACRACGDCVRACPLKAMRIVTS